MDKLVNKNGDNFLNPGIQLGLLGHLSYTLIQNLQTNGSRTSNDHTVLYKVTVPPFYFFVG